MRKTALITGASQGIGKAIATVLAQSGYDLALVGRNSHKLWEVKQQLENDEVKCIPIVADLTLPDAPGEVIKQVYENFASLDIVVNNAGMAVNQKVEETELETWNTIFAVNARAPYFYVRRRFLI